jgi:hypothetical protein
LVASLEGSLFILSLQFFYLQNCFLNFDNNFTISLPYDF